MTLFECLTTFISNVPGLAAKLPGGISPHIIPEGSTVFPLLVMREISGVCEPPTHDGGASPLSRVRLEFTAWGGSYKLDEQVILALLVALRPFNGYLGGDSASGKFCVVGTAGPRSTQDPTTKLVGIQVDVIGFLNLATLS